jgi:hypothetical protein
MFGAVTMLAATAAALVAIVAAAVRIPGVARIFLLTQVGYWSLSYLARPIVLVWVQPLPGFADSVADPRLADIGYAHGIEMVMRPVVVGLWVYAALVVAYAWWVGRRRFAGPTDHAPDPALVPTLAVVFAVGMIGRFAALATGSAGSAGDVESSNPILSGVATLAAIGAIGLIVFYRSTDRLRTVAVIGGLLLLQLLWTLAVQSKSPIMGAALALAVRFALDGWTRRRVLGVAALSIVSVGGFGWLQSIKLSAGAAAAADAADAQYPAVVQPFMSILRRFDLLAAATDAYYMDGRPWLSTGEVLRYALQSLVPAQLLGTEKFHSGTEWAGQVRGSSVDMTRVSVSLAEGNVNEGYVLGGYAGVVVAVAFTFGLLLFATWALRARHVVLVALGLTVIGAPVLFERGILGSTEVLGKSLQIAVAIWIVEMTVREFRQRSMGPSGPAIRPEFDARAGTTTGGPR